MMHLDIIEDERFMLDRKKVFVAYLTVLVLEAKIINSIVFMIL